MGLALPQILLVALFTTVPVAGVAQTLGAVGAVKVVAEVAAPVMGWGVVIMVAMELASVVVEAVAQEQRLGEALDPQES